MNKTGALEGVRVLDMSTILLGPWAAQTLGDMGADVVKVETPAGDLMRQVGPSISDDMGSLHLGLNRNKRSIVIDLKQRAGFDLLMRLATDADVMLHNLRPSVVDKLGLHYEVFRDANPAIIYCGACGFHRGGPLEDKPAYDDIIQAASGLADLQSSISGEPRYVPSAAADKITSMAVVSAITAALFHRERSGEGQAIEVPMFETLVGFLMVEHLYGHCFEPSKGAAGYPRVVAPGRKPYATLDGYIAALPYSDQNWQDFFTLAGRVDLAGDARFASAGSRLEHVDELYEALGNIMRTRTTADWLQALEAAGIPVMPVNSPDDLLNDAQLESSNFWRLIEHPTEGLLRSPDPPVTFSKTPSDVRRPPPRLGEHTREILMEAGLCSTDIEALEREEVVSSLTLGHD